MGEMSKCCALKKAGRLLSEHSAPLSRIGSLRDAVLLLVWEAQWRDWIGEGHHCTILAQGIFINIADW